MQRDINDLPLTFLQVRSMRDETSDDLPHRKSLLDAVYNFLAATESDTQQDRARFFTPEAGQSVFNAIGEAFEQFDAAQKKDPDSMKIKGYCERVVRHRLLELNNNSDMLSRIYQQQSNKLKSRLG